MQAVVCPERPGRLSLLMGRPLQESGVSRKEWFVIVSVVAELALMVVGRVDDSIIPKRWLTERESPMSRRMWLVAAAYRVHEVCVVVYSPLIGVEVTRQGAAARWSVRVGGRENRARHRVGPRADQPKPFPALVHCFEVPDVVH
jgi:hypothetical protein